MTDSERMTDAKFLYSEECLRAVRKSEWGGFGKTVLCNAHSIAVISNHLLGWLAEKHEDIKLERISDNWCISWDYNRVETAAFTRLQALAKAVNATTPPKPSEGNRD